MALTSMKLSADEAKEMDSCVPTDGGPAYPYGLAIYLNDEVLKKLGMSTMPDVGTKLTLQAVVEVTGNSQRQTQEGKTVCMDLQITDMELTAPAGDQAQRMYPGMNP
jgi:hypothetical protein